MYICFFIDAMLRIWIQNWNQTSYSWLTLWPNISGWPPCWEVYYDCICWLPGEKQQVEQSFQNQKNIFLLSSPMVELTPLPSMLSDVMSTSSRSSQSPPQPPRTRTAQGSLDSSSFDRYNTFHYTPINTREATEITIRKTWIWCLFTIL